jgi:hypothetical protein
MAVIVFVGVMVTSPAPHPPRPATSMNNQKKERIFFLSIFVSPLFNKKIAVRNHLWWLVGHFLQQLASPEAQRPLAPLVCFEQRNHKNLSNI